MIEPKKLKFCIRELNLLERDRDILLNSAGLLNDNIIDAAQKLLVPSTRWPAVCVVA